VALERARRDQHELARAGEPDVAAELELAAVGPARRCRRGARRARDEVGAAIEPARERDLLARVLPCGIGRVAGERDAHAIARAADR
jgi:hypothetical protein